MYPTRNLLASPVTRRSLIRGVVAFTTTKALFAPKLLARSSRKETSMLTSVTKTVQIETSVQKAYGFLADPANMVQWAIHNLKSIRPVGENVWSIETPRGEGKFVPHFEQAHGILDHEFLDPKEGSWHVPARIVPIGTDASVYIITLTKPEPMPAEAFTQGIALMDEELLKLKEILENK